MKLIFKEDSAEINELLGFVDADVEINKIRSDLFTATNEVIELIGQQVYDYVHGLYEANDDDEVKKFLIYCVQYPIAVNAWRMYVPSGDLAHTNNGRKMRNDDSTGEKSAFEWMINRDNDALEKRYYKALDTLLNYLDQTNPTIKEAVLDPATEAVKWKDTEAFQKTHKLFVRTTADFEESFAIHSRLLLLKLQPGLNICERDEILPRIGKERFLLLKDSVKNSEAPEDEKLLSLVKEACVYSALSWGLRRLRVLLLPEGVLQRYSGERVNSINTKAPEKLEAELAAQSFAADAEKVLKAIESYIKPAPTEEEIKEGKIFPDACFNDDDNFLST